jgi:hypothetical protein
VSCCVAPFLNGLAVDGLVIFFSIFVVAPPYFVGFVNGETVVLAVLDVSFSFFTSFLTELDTFLAGSFLTVFFAATLSYSFLRSNGLIFILPSSKPPSLFSYGGSLFIS